MAKEYGIAADTSSLLSSASGTERDDTDEEICSFDLGPEPFDPADQGRLRSDEWLDDHQQGLIPGGSEPSHKEFDYNKYLVMPKKPSILDMMRQDIDDSDEVPPTSTERTLTPTIGFSYDYATDAPPDIQRVVDTPMHSTPYPDPPMLSARPGPVLLPPRPRASSVPPTPKTVKRMTIRYLPVTETITPPISPARAHAMDRQIDPDTPSPTHKPGRSRGRGKWRTPQKATPGVGTRSKTRQAELDEAEATQAQASRAMWPPRPDPTAEIKHLTRGLKLSDRPQDAHRELQRILPTHQVDLNQNVVRPPVAGIHTKHRDIFFIPPPRAGGGAQGASTPVSTATLGLIHRQDPSLTAQLRKDPASLTVHSTRLRVYFTMRLIRTGMLGQLASLQQWEEAMHLQDEH